mgnify:CR=1 FL=1
MEIAEICEELDGAAAMRADHGRELRRVHPELRISVVVEVELLIRERLSLAEHTLGDRQLTPDRVAQMRQIEAAEYAVPVRASLHWARPIVVAPPADPHGRGTG